MNEFTVEVVTTPVEDGDWSTLRGLTDIIPGTILIEDTDEPMLVFPVEAETLKTAAVFVQGVMTVVGANIVWGRAYRTEPCDFEQKGEPHILAAPDFAPSWLEDEDQTRKIRQLVS